MKSPHMGWLNYQQAIIMDAYQYAIYIENRLLRFDRYIVSGLCIDQNIKRKVFWHLVDFLAEFPSKPQECHTQVRNADCSIVHR